MSKQNSKIKKSCQTIFPIGFGIKKLEDRIIILDFIDTDYNEDEDDEIIASIAMTEEKAKYLIESLKEAINGEKDETE
jgi:translation elongation factor EF-1beta